jgi:hypothetical protein
LATDAHARIGLVTIRLRSLLLWPLLWLALLALPCGAQAAAVPPCHHAQAGAVHGAALHHAAVASYLPAAMLAQAGHDRSCTLHGHGHERGCASSCGACCAAVALAPAPPSAPPAAAPAFVAIPFRAGHLPSVDPSLPERPPRTLFA